MKETMFSVFDHKAMTFSPPIVETNRATAIRAYEHAHVQEGSAMRKNPEDYSLFEVGQFNPENGVITPCEAQMVITSVDVMRGLLGNEQVDRGEVE